MKQYGIIYLARNKHNGKVYVGLTIKTLEERKREHIRLAHSKNAKKYSFQHALLKYGTDSFEWSVIDTADTKEELNEKEIKWIAHYESFKDTKKGYNRTPGGDNMTDRKGIFHYDWKGNSIGYYSDIRLLKKELGEKQTRLEKCLNGTVRSMYKQVYLRESDFPTEELRQLELVRRKNMGKKRVHLFDEAGNYIQTYDSESKAGKDLGILKNQVKMCCEGKIVTVKNVMFIYESENDSENLSLEVKEEVLRRVSLMEDGLLNAKKSLFVNGNDFVNSDNSYSILL